MGLCQSRDSHPKSSTDRPSIFTSNPEFMRSLQKQLTCEICNVGFNRNDRCPMMLCLNQHNACKRCVDSFKQTDCPFCRAQFSRASVAKNRVLLEMIPYASPKVRQAEQLELQGKQSKDTQGDTASSKALEKKQSNWWNIVSDHKPEDKQLIRQTLTKAKQNKYDQVVYCILMALKKPIATISVLEEYDKDIPIMIDLSIFKGLEVLRLNTVVDSKPMAKNGLKGFGYLPRLKTLELCSRHTRQIYYLGLFPNLQVLDLSFNNIDKMQNLDQFARLRQLNLCNNRIGKIEGVDKLLELETLRLSFNRIERIQNLEGLQKLRELYLDNNKLRQIQNLEGVPQLEVISLIDNQIRLVQNLHFLRKLKRVAVAGNPLDQQACIAEIQALKDLFEVDIAK